MSVPVAPAHVRLEGFSERSAQRFLRQWQQAPPPVAAAWLLVREVPQRRWRHGSHTGYFTPRKDAPDEVELKAGRWSDAVAFHELGHLAWSVLLEQNPLALKHYETILWPHFRRQAPTSYQRGSLYEVFAEWYVAVFKQPRPRGYRAAPAELADWLRGVLA